MAHILIIDDKTDITSLISDLLIDEGHITTEAHNISQAQEALTKNNYDVIILDIWLEDKKTDGIGLLKIIRRNYRNTPVVMMSGHAAAETAALAIKIGAYDFIEKPFKSNKILFVINKAIEFRLLNESKIISQDNIKDIIVGKSNIISNIREKCIVFSKTNARLAIYGKGGTGKTLIGRTIDRLSKNQLYNGASRGMRRLIHYRPYMKTKEQLYNDIYGDDANNLSSIFSLAQHGTLLIDDIHVFPMDLQQDILEILQRSTINYHNKKMELDIRLIVTSTINYHDLIMQKMLDENLYARISTNTLEIPDLSMRLEDLDDLIKHFINKLEKATLNRPLSIDKEAIELLYNHKWLGNVAELRSVIYELGIMNKYYNLNSIGMKDLEYCLSKRNEDISDEKKDVQLNILTQKSYREAKQIFEKQYILSQIKNFGGNVSKTANFIGLDRTALHRKMKDLGIDLKED